MVGAIESQSDLQTAVRPHTMKISGAARTAIVRRTNSIILTTHTTVEAHNVFFRVVVRGALYVNQELIVEENRKFYPIHNSMA